MGTVLIPELTRSLRDGDKDVIAHAESRALELRSAGAAGHARFDRAERADRAAVVRTRRISTAADTAATAQALVFLALGLPAQVLVKTLSPAFFAREDTLAPLWATLKAVVVAIVCAILLVISLARPASPPYRARRWSNALSLIRQGRRELRLFGRSGRTQTAAAHRRGGADHGRALWLATSVAAARRTGSHRPSFCCS